jgi:hypothetical protein
MPRSTTDSNYTTSNYSPSQSATSTPNSTAPTSRASSPQRLAKVKRPIIKKRIPRSKSQPGNWHNLLGIPPEHSNAPSQQSSLRIAQSYTDLVGKSDLQSQAPPRAMGGHRTSLSMNGGLDPKRRTTSYDEQYQYKDNAYGSARERVHRESPIVAELRTNVIVSIDKSILYSRLY